MSLFVFDVDHFKWFNDNHGHDVGDLVLKRIADVAKETLRDIDILGRVGGEEFAVVLPETNADGAAVVAERLRVALEHSEFDVNGETLHITASFGVSVVDPAESPALDAALKKADVALYQAKESGRNRVVLSG